MSLVLELTPELESDLTAEAARLGLSLPEYTLCLLTTARGTIPVLSTGADLVAYWQTEGLVGTRSEIADAPAHARALRERAEKRERS